MKFKLFQFYKYFLLTFFLFGSLQVFSNFNSQNYNQLDEIKEKITLYEQYIYFHRLIYAPNNEVENIEQWINYFEKEKNKYKDDNELAYINFILVYLYKLNYNLDKAIDLGMSTYYANINNSKKNKLLCELLRMVEWCYHKKDNNLGLISINKEKFKVCDKGVVDYHSAYFNMGLYDLALKNYKENIGYNEPSYSKYDLYTQAYHNNDFGVYYMYDNKIDSALYHYKKSIFLFKKQNKKNSSYKKEDTEFMLTVVKGNIGTCLLKTGEYEKAIPYYLIEIEGCNKYYGGRNWLGSEKSYKRIALCYIKTNQFKKATFFIRKLKNFKTLYYRLKSEYYTQLNNIDSTLYFKDKYIATSDSIYKEKLKQQEIESLNTLDFNDEIKQQQEQIKFLEEEDTNKSSKIRFISVTSLVISFFFFLLLYFFKEKNIKQKLVAAQKDEIEKTLDKNKTLLKELNHRVKNNLQMVSSVISLQATKITDESSKKHFNAAVNRIKVLSQIHNSLYSKNELKEIDLKNYVITLKNYLIKSIINPETKVDFKINVKPNLYINNDKKATIGLIINELVTNSFKYAFTNRNQSLITISIIKKEQFYHFCYTDNGKGFNYEEIDKSKSIGLNLILRLVNQLGEEAEVNSNNGVKISFKFKG
jgi:two-component sensor histidine kinase